MSHSTTWLRRLSLRLLRHAMWVLPGERSTWADAMCKELQHLDDDRAALGWAFGCVFTAYRESFIFYFRGYATAGSAASWERWEVTRAEGRARYVWQIGALVMGLGLFFPIFVFSSIAVKGFGWPSASAFVGMLSLAPVSMMTGYFLGAATWWTTDKIYLEWRKENLKGQDMKESEITSSEALDVALTENAISKRERLWEEVQGRRVRQSLRLQERLILVCVVVGLATSFLSWNMGERGTAIISAVVMIIFFVGSVAGRIRSQIEALAEIVRDLEQSKS